MLARSNIRVIHHQCASTCSAVQVHTAPCVEITDTKQTHDIYEASLHADLSKVQPCWIECTHYIVCVLVQCDSQCVRDKASLSEIGAATRNWHTHRMCTAILLSGIWPWQWRESWKLRQYSNQVESASTGYIICLVWSIGQHTATKLCFCTHCKALMLPTSCLPKSTLKTCQSALRFLVELVICHTHSMSDHLLKARTVLANLQPVLGVVLNVLIHA